MTSTGLRAAVFAAAWVMVAAIAAGASPHQADPESKAKSTPTPKPPFSRMAVKPATITFKEINLKTGPTVETHNFTISDTGNATLDSITVAATGSTAFSVAAAPATLQPGAVATVTVRFQPSKAGTFAGKIAVTSAATKGAKSVKVHLSGSAKGKLPTATPTLIPTPTASPAPPTPTTGQPTPTSTASPPPPSAGAPAAIFVANSDSDAIVGYPIGSNGTASPNFELGGATPFDLPLAVAFDSLGYMYVTDNEGEAISVFAPGSNGHASPIAVINGSNTGLFMPSGIVVGITGKIYVADYGTSSILVFPPLGDSTGNLNEAPVATISGSNTGLSSPSAIALDAGGNIYVTSIFTTSVTIFPPIGSTTGNLNESPTATIVGPNGAGNLTGLGAPLGIAVDVSGKIYVANSGSSENSITVYPALGTSVGKLNEAPIATIAGTSTELRNPQGLALAPSGAIFVTNINSPRAADAETITEYPALGSSTGSLNEAPLARLNASGAEFLTVRPLIFAANSTDSGAVTAFAAGSTGSVASPEIIDGTGTGLMGGAPIGVALDASGRIYASSPNLGTIEVFAPGSSGNAAPVATISGAQTGLGEAPENAPLGVALDAGGNIYTTTTSNSVVVFPPLGGGSGNINESPTATISGASTMLNSPTGLTIGATGNIYVANSSGGVTIYPALGSGTGNLNEPPTATIAGSNTGLGAAKGIALDAAGRIYVTNEQTISVEVFAPLGNSTGNLNAAPIATISGGNTELSVPIGITIDTIGNIYVGDFSAGILEYPPLGGSTGNLNVAPIALISGGNTGLDQPELLTIAP